MSKKHILVTGASGFIGQRFIEVNRDHYHLEQVSLRTQSVEQLELEGVDVIVHLAGIAHRMEKTDPQLYFDINTELTKQLFDQATASGVRLFIFISTIKVYGEETGEKIVGSTQCEPGDDPYGLSKLMAEQYLLKQTCDTGVAIIRPPLVYGPRVKGNLIKLLHLARKPWPLPFAAIANRRTMVFLDNLIAMIDAVIERDATGIFLAGDDTPISTTRLVSEIRAHMGKTQRLFKLPGVLSWFLQRIAPAQYNRLFGTLEMDPAESFNRLNFTPPHTISHGIGEMVKWYNEQ